MVTWWTDLALVSFSLLYIQNSYLHNTRSLNYCNSYTMNQLTMIQRKAVLHHCNVAKQLHNRIRWLTLILLLIHYWKVLHFSIRLPFSAGWRVTVVEKLSTESKSSAVKELRKRCVSRLNILQLSSRNNAQTLWEIPLGWHICAPSTLFKTVLNAKWFWNIFIVLEIVCTCWISRNIIARLCEPHMETENSCK